MTKIMPKLLDLVGLTIKILKPAISLTLIDQVLRLMTGFSIGFKVLLITTKKPKP
jgi:hypothetical protein